MAGNCFSPSQRFSQIDSHAHILPITLLSNISLFCFFTSSSALPSTSLHSILHVALKLPANWHSNVSGGGCCLLNMQSFKFYLPSHCIKSQQWQNNECACLWVCILIWGVCLLLVSLSKTLPMRETVHDYIDFTLHTTIWYVGEFVFAGLCFSVYCMFRNRPWRSSCCGDRPPGGLSLFVAAHPLPLHLTNYCATSMPLMKPGTCPSVLLWAWLVAVYWYKLNTVLSLCCLMNFFAKKCITRGSTDSLLSILYSLLMILKLKLF